MISGAIHIATSVAASSALNSSLRSSHRRHEDSCIVSSSGATTEEDVNNRKPLEKPIFTIGEKIAFYALFLTMICAILVATILN